MLLGWGWPGLDWDLHAQKTIGIDNDNSVKPIRKSTKLDPCDASILIIDRDPNQNSGTVMLSTIEDIGLEADYMTFVPLNMSMYNLVFVCLGVFEDNHVLTSSEGQKLAQYLNDGGNLYMEGGDTWFYDPPTTVHSMFNIYGVGDGLADLNVVTGLYGTFAQGMSFSYSGDNSWIDRINAIPPAYELFKNQYPFYITGVAYDAGSYKTIGVSHEFGGFDDGMPPSTKMELMYKYLEFFDVSTSIQSSFYASQTETCISDNVNFFDLSFGNIISWNWAFEGGSPATSTYPNPTVVYNETGWFDVTLIVSDGTDVDSLTIEDYIQVEHPPEIPEKPIGPEYISAFPGEISEYTTYGSSYSTQYNWVLEPEDAGVVSQNGLSCTIDWTDWWEGTANIKVCGVNGCGESDFSEELIISCLITDIAQQDDYSIEVYPNPSGGNFYVNLKQLQRKAVLTILNVFSEEIYSIKLENTPNEKLMLNLSDIAKGVYFIRITTAESDFVKKIIIQ